MIRFVDSSGWGAWLDPREAYHQRAVAAFDEVWLAGDLVVTTNWVLAELTALLISPLRFSRPRQIQLMNSIRTSKSLRIIEIDRATEILVWRFWELRRDKDWSLVDCASFVVMQRERLTEAITADHHFEQAGFVRLLK